MAARPLLELAQLIRPDCACEAVAVLEAAQLTCGSTARAASRLNLSAEQLANELAPSASEEVRSTVQKLLERAFALGDLAWTPPLRRWRPERAKDESELTEGAVSEPGPGAAAEGDALHAKELAKKKFWVEELVAIARRAGPAAELPLTRTVDGALPRAARVLCVARGIPTLTPGWAEPA